MTTEIKEIIKQIADNNFLEEHKRIKYTDAFLGHLKSFAFELVEKLTEDKII